MYCFGNDAKAEWLVTSGGFERGCFTSPGLGNPGSGSGTACNWLRPSGSSWIAGWIWRRFLKCSAPVSFCTSYLLGEPSVGCWNTGGSARMVFLGSNWKMKCWLPTVIDQLAPVSVLTAPPCWFPDWDSDIDVQSGALCTSAEWAILLGLADLVWLASPCRSTSQDVNQNLTILLSSCCSFRL